MSAEIIVDGNTPTNVGLRSSHDRDNVLWMPGDDWQSWCDHVKLGPQLDRLGYITDWALQNLRANDEHYDFLNAVRMGEFDVRNRLDVVLNNPNVPKMP